MTPEEIHHRHHQVLTQFTIRARRLQAHSLSSWKHLHLVHANAFIVAPGMGTPALVTTYLPDEEQLESAAARARPLFLKGDPIHYSAVINALGYFARHHPDHALRARIKASKTLWASVKGDGTPGGTLFESWLYGDLIHAGMAAREAATGTTLQERFQAAATMISRVFIATHATMGLVEECQAAGLFTLPSTAYRELVTVNTGTIQQHEVIYIDLNGAPPMGPGRDASVYREWRTGVFVHPDAWEAFCSDVQALKAGRGRPSAA